MDELHARKLYAEIFGPVRVRQHSALSAPKLTSTLLPNIRYLYLVRISKLQYVKNLNFLNQ
jgi:hypothetical protein